MKTKKLIICILLALSIILTTITACSKSNNNDENITGVTESTFSDNSTTTIPSTTMPSTTQKYSVPVSELGFYNMYEMGNYLVEIDGYEVTPSTDEDDYVYVVFSNSRTFQISNGYIQYYDPIDLDTLEVKLEFKYAYPCEIVNNDYIDVPSRTSGSADGSKKISKRITSEIRDDFVVLVDEGDLSRSEMWFIPISLIDVDRKAEKCVEDGENGKRTRYKLFLTKYQ